METTLSQIANGLIEHPTAWLLALALGAIAYLYREGRAQEAAHRETLKAVLPVCEKLADAVEACERIATAALKE